MKKSNNKPMKNAGFTLIEMIVTMFVFSIIIAAATGLFISAIRGQSRTLATQRILDQTSYALEYMGRALRMADKEKNPPTCLPSYGLNYATTTSGKGGLKFINDDGDCQEFFLDNDYRLKESKIGVINPLTSPDLRVENFNINLIGQSQDNNLQPRVTIFLEIRRKAAEHPKLKIQTTISQRRLDILE